MLKRSVVPVNDLPCCKEADESTCFRCAGPVCASHVVRCVYCAVKLCPGCAHPTMVAGSERCRYGCKDGPSQAEKLIDYLHASASLAEKMDRSLGILIDECTAKVRARLIQLRELDE